MTTGTATEQAFAEKMEAEGWQVYKNGFPDFLCLKDGQAILVEVKANKHQWLTTQQEKMMTLLTERQFVGFVWLAREKQLIKLANKDNSDEGTFGNSKLPLSLASIVVKTLYNIDNKPIKEIASIFDVSRETVRQLILKAKGG